MLAHCFLMVDYQLSGTVANDSSRHVSDDVTARSFLVSADCAHGVHPNYSAKHQALLCELW